MNIDCTGINLEVITKVKTTDLLLLSALVISSN